MSGGKRESRGPLVAILAALSLFAAGCNQSGKVGAAGSEGIAPYCEGALTPPSPPGVRKTSDVNAILTQHFQEFSDCEGEYLLVPPDTTQFVRAEFVIAANGKVTSACASRASTVRDVETIRCVLGVVASLDFGGGDSGSIVVSRPIQYSSMSGGVGRYERRPPDYREHGYSPNPSGPYY